MLLKEYIEETRKTVRYSKDVEYNYLHYGVIGEIGEFCGKLAKYYRKDQVKPLSELNLELAYELGDIFWFLVRLIDCNYIDLKEEVLESIKKINIYKLNFGGEHNYSTYDLITDLTIFLINFHEGDDTEKFTRIFAMLYILKDIGVNLGYSLEEIAQMNIDKLTGRIERGTIKGDGDVR